MKDIFLKILFIFFFIFNCKAQIVFNKTYKDSSSTTGWCSLKSINDSNYYFSGSSATPKRKSDMIVVKTDSKGDQVWAKKYGKLKRDAAWDLLEANDRLVVAGQCEQDTIYPQINTYSDICFLTIDTSAGVLISAVLFGDSLDDKISKIFRTSDGNFIGVGYANRTSSINGYSDGLLIKFNSTLNILWAKKYSPHFKTNFNSLAESVDGHFYITGAIDTLSGSNTHDVLVVKTDTSGNLIWSKRIDNGFAEEGYSIYILNNSIYVGGKIDDLLSASFYAAFISQLDTSGNTIWFKKYYTNTPLSSAGLYYNNNSFYLTTSTYLLEIDMFGNVISSANMNVSFLDLQFTSDKGFISTGSGSGSAVFFKTDSLLNSCVKSIKAFNDSLLINVYSKPAFLLQNLFTPFLDSGIYEVNANIGKTVICETATEINNHENPRDTIFIYPNPVADFLKIKSKYSSEFSIRQPLLIIINSLGQQCISETLNFKYLEEQTIDLRSFPSGVYFLSLSNSPKLSMQYKFIKK